MSGMKSIGGSIRHEVSAASSSSDPSLNCTFLGSLSSRHGRDILSQLCLQIAQQSKLRHHFVERKDMDKMTRQFFTKSIKNVKSRSSAIHLKKPPETMPLEMKVFFVRDQLERLSDEQVSIKLSDIIVFLYAILIESRCGSPLRIDHYSRSTIDRFPTWNMYGIVSYYCSIDCWPGNSRQYSETPSPRYEFLIASTNQSNSISTTNQLLQSLAYDASSSTI